jgi:hypothetical protein
MSRIFAIEKNRLFALMFGEFVRLARAGSSWRVEFPGISEM